jgi:hypothetical protein
MSGAMGTTIAIREMQAAQNLANSAASKRAIEQMAMYDPQVGRGSLSLNTHARCDWCEGILIAEDEDEVMENGWIVVKLDDDSLDFCALSCLTKWSMSDAAVEMLAPATSSEDEE